MTTILRNKKTEQECSFDDQAGADNFLAAVDSPEDWTDPAAPAVETPVDDQPAATE